MGFLLRILTTRSWCRHLRHVISSPAATAFRSAASADPLPVARDEEGSVRRSPTLRFVLVGDETCKVHLDGYNVLPLLTGETKESPRKEFFYFNDDSELIGLRSEHADARRWTGAALRRRRDRLHQQCDAWVL
jgi:hypothetical protein